LLFQQVLPAFWYSRGGSFFPVHLVRFYLLSKPLYMDAWDMQRKEDSPVSDEKQSVAIEKHAE
jgi:hypothetical protein